MPEEVSKHFALPNITPPGPVTFREILDNDTKKRDIIPLNGFGVVKDESGSIMLKMRKEVSEY